MLLRSIVFALLAVIASSHLRNFAEAGAEKEAELMIREGIALRRAGKDDEALRSFERAYGHAPTPRAAAQLGLCEQSLGLWVAAERHLTEALAARDDGWVTKNRAILRSSLDSVSARLATLEVRGEPAGAEVSLDGRVLGVLPLKTPVRVVPGQGRLEVIAPGFSKASRTIVTNPGQYTRETVILSAEQQKVADNAAYTAPQVTPPAPSSPVQPALVSETHKREADTGKRSWMRPVAWTAAAAGAAALGVAVAYHAISLVNTNKFNNHNESSMTGRCDAELLGAGGTECARWLRNRDRALSVAVPSYVTAGVLGLGAGILFYVSRDQSAPETARASAVERPIMCGDGPGAVGIACRFTF